MTANESRPAGDQAANASTRPLQHSPDLAAREALLGQADRALKAALRSNLTGPDVEHLAYWCASERIALRRERARAAVAAALAMIGGES